MRNSVSEYLQEKTTVNRNKAILDNLGLVKFAIRKHLRLARDFTQYDDLFQHGVVGLAEGLDSLNEPNNNYLIASIRGRVTEWFRAYRRAKYGPGPSKRTVRDDAMISLEDNPECEDETLPDPETRLFRNKVMNVVKQMQFNPNELHVLKEHVFGDLTLDEVGGRLNVSRQRVSQIKEKMLNKILCKLYRSGVDV